MCKKREREECELLTACALVLRIVYVVYASAYSSIYMYDYVHVVSAVQATILIRLYSFTCKCANIAPSAPSTIPPMTALLSTRKYLI